MAKFKPGAEINVDLDLLRQQKVALRRSQQGIRGSGDISLLDGVFSLLDTIEDSLEPPLPGINTAPPAPPGVVTGNVIVDPLTLPEALRAATGNTRAHRTSASRYYIGNVDDYDAHIHVEAGHVLFLWGCRSHCSERRARRHWANGMSQVSGEARPHAVELIDFVAGVAAHHGWKWTD